MAGGDRENADDRLIAALAAGMTRQEAAETAGVSESTVYRRLADEDFTRRLRDARAAFLDRTMGKLSDATTRAADVLSDLMGDNQPPSVRLSAARAILEFSGKLRESVDTEKRLAELEKRVGRSSTG